MNCGKTYLVKSETEGVNLGKSLKFDYGIGINLKAIGVKSVLTAIELGYSENYFSIIGSDSFEQTISQKDHHHNHFRISFMLY